MPLDSDFKVSLKIGSGATAVDYDYWDTITGGGVDANEVKYTPFDGTERTYVSKRTTANVVLSREYLESRDGAILAKAASLQLQPATVTVLDIDSDGKTQQNRPPYKGWVKAITPPDTDSDGTGIAKISIEISVGTRD